MNLIARFKEGSMEAMEAIVDRYEDRIFTFGLKMCGQLQDAEDITQDTFLNAFRYLKDFQGRNKTEELAVQTGLHGLYSKTAKEEVRTGS
jgi:DNA-directed RNA polymerase specialized sigma24 family protein